MKKDKFSSLKHLLEALVVGVMAGLVIGVFRLTIEYSQKFWLRMFKLAHQQPSWLVVIILAFALIGIIAGYLVKQQPHAGGSGIPEVELQLQGKLKLAWWPVFWRKLVGGSLVIGSGLFLGREGPSIQLGSTLGQGLGQGFHEDATTRRVLLATGAASGLSAAFGAPLGGAMFVLEEVFHNFSPRVWLNALAGSLAANYVASSIFGQRPVLAMTYNQSLPTNLYWHLLVLGVILGLFGRIYQLGLLNFKRVYEKITFLPSWLHGLIPLACLVPIMYFWPAATGGGNGLILSLGQIKLVQVLAAIFLLRLAFSIISYDAGLPGGIFLPILTMGALLGAVYGQLMVNLGLLSPNFVVNLVIFSMAGYFAAIVRSPFTAILLITEMVGSLLHLMPLAVVSLVAYVVNELLGGEPIYESLAAQMVTDEGEPTANADQLTISVFEASQLVGKQIKEIPWPDNTLVKLIQRGSAELIPSGNTKLLAGDLLVLEVDAGQRGLVYDQISALQGV